MRDPQDAAGLLASAGGPLAAMKAAASRAATKPRIMFPPVFVASTPSPSLKSRHENARFVAGMAISLALPVAAQDFPSKPIRVIAPFGPGTATDTVARVIAAEMGKLTGQSVVVENKPGAEGQIGAQAAATAAPDGYTLFITTQTTQAINQHVYKSLTYDPVRTSSQFAGSRWVRRS